MFLAVKSLPYFISKFERNNKKMIDVNNEKITNKLCYFDILPSDVLSHITNLLPTKNVTKFRLVNKLVHKSINNLIIRVTRENLDKIDFGTNLKLHLELAIIKNACELTHKINKLNKSNLIKLSIYTSSELSYDVRISQVEEFIKIFNPINITYLCTNVLINNIPKTIEHMCINICSLCSYVLIKNIETIEHMCTSHLKSNMDVSLNKNIKKRTINLEYTIVNEIIIHNCFLMKFDCVNIIF